MIKTTQSIRASVFSFVLVLAVLLISVSCSSEGNVRKNKEEAPPVTAKTKSPHGDMKMPTPGGETAVKPGGNQSKAHFHWDTPEGWGEKRQASGIRLATFTAESGGVCTIIPLAGDAGGLKANISRWLGQMTTGAGANAPMMSAQGNPETVEKLLKSAEQFLTKGELPVVFIDYTNVTAKPTDSSMLAAVISLSSSTVFFKMTGTKTQMTANKVKFKALCQSFVIDTAKH